MYRTSEPPRATQDSLLLVVPTDFGNRTNYMSRSFSHYAPTCWNKLPYHLRNISEKEKFKTSLKTYYFSKYLLELE